VSLRCDIPPENVGNGISLGSGGDPADVVHRLVMGGVNQSAADAPISFTFKGVNRSAMYIPPSFAETDLNTLHDFIEQHSFATLVSHGDDDLVATHLPLLLERETGAQGRLIGHMARANQFWQQAEGQNVLTLFSGPHTYISPSWYKDKNVVPTWNYVTVHVHGRLRLTEGKSELLEIVQRYVKFYEAGMTQPWSLDNAEPNFIDGLLDAIVGFTIDIDHIEGKWKLNQNHDRQRRENVIQGLKETGSEEKQAIANLMEASLKK
jgi:transcriptional regulator